MADSYLLHTMKEEELLQILCIFSACARTPKTLDELCAAVELMGLASEGTVYSTVRRRVLELEEYGYLQRTGKQIRMRESLLAGLGEAELLALEDYVRFSAGVTYPRVAGSFLRRSIRRELERRGLEERTESPFLFRGNVKCNVFDEVVVCQLLEAIQQRREAGCFLSQEEIEKLKSSLGTPDGTQESIQLPGCAAQAMLPQRENLRVILQAMRQGRMVDYEYRTREDRRPKSASAVPWKVEYGAFDRGVILRKLLSLGPGVTLLGPASLQEELLDLLEQTRTRQEQAIL